LLYSEYRDVTKGVKIIEKGFIIGTPTGNKV
jgi:hypothetical protein